MIGIRTRNTRNLSNGTLKISIREFILVLEVPILEETTAIEVLMNTKTSSERLSFLISKNYLSEVRQRISRAVLSVDLYFRQNRVFTDRGSRRKVTDYVKN